MIIEKYKALDVERVGDTESGIEAGISNESLPFVFEMLSKALYSNPIGSIIREITSNCFDAHVEAGIDKPVVIRKTHDEEEGYSIEFIDEGIGMSAERLVKIYMNYFTSTKRGSNSQIGGFGLGSKTPLAYADMFYITTVHAGLKYNCIMHKGTSKPELESLYGWDYKEEIITKWDEDTQQDVETTITRKYPHGEETDEPSGTTIRIIMEDGDIEKSRYGYSSDKKVTFLDELKNQLTYFDGVYFKGWNITNDYDIYEGNYFKFRSDIDQERTLIHICIGNVRYPIDFTKVNIDKTNVNIPIAVKFDIGELNITPSRENLRYDEVGIAKIQERVNLAVAEIREFYTKQNPNISDFQTFLKVRREKPSIMFNREKNHGMKIWQNSGLEKVFKFQPVLALGIEKIPKEFFFMYEYVGRINSSGERTPESGTLIDNFKNTFYKFLIVDKGEQPSHYTNVYIAREFGDTYLIKRRKLDYKADLERLGLSNSKKLGKFKILLDYMNLMKSTLEGMGVGYYSDYKPTEEWVAAYKKSTLEQSLAYKRKMEQKVFIRIINWGRGGQDVKEQWLINRTGVMVYGFKEDKTLLNNICSIVRNNRRNLYNMKSSRDRNNNVRKNAESRVMDAFLVIQIAQSVVPIMEEAKENGCKVAYCREFFKSIFFREIWTAKVAAETMSSLVHSGISVHELKEKFIPGYKEAYNTAIDAYKKYWRDDYYPIPTEYTENLKLIPRILEPVEKFKNNPIFHTKLPLSNVISVSSFRYSTDDSEKEYAEYLKYKGFRLLNFYYLKSTKQLKEEKRQKQYELNLKQILDTFNKTNVIYLLTDKTKTDEQISESSGETDISDNTILSQDDRQRCDSNTGEEISGYSEDDESRLRNTNEEDRVFQQETSTNNLQCHSEDGNSTRNEEERREGEVDSSSEGYQETGEESSEEVYEESADEYFG